MNTIANSVTDNTVTATLTTIDASGIQSSVVYSVDDKSIPFVVGCEIETFKAKANGDLSSSVKVILPVISDTDINAFMASKVGREVIKDAIKRERNGLARGMIVRGHKVIPFSSVTIDNVLKHLEASDESGKGYGQFSSEKVINWWNTSDAKDIFIISLADRQGIDCEAIPEDKMIQYTQIANSVVGNLVKLTGKKKPVFDPRVKATLERVLDITNDGSLTHRKLVNALIAPETLTEDDILANLGL